KSAKKVRDKIASWTILRNSKANLNNIAYYSRAILQGWKNYYGKYGRAELKRVLFYLTDVTQ
ncbi:MAG: group II intron reverse transcriptase/maturase, partial [Methylococcales bacterium]|nr:group II intron reverse transcriptase/maturase [Methylococcales bacterium]